MVGQLSGRPFKPPRADATTGMARHSKCKSSESAIYPLRRHRHHDLTACAPVRVSRYVRVRVSWFYRIRRVGEVVTVPTEPKEDLLGHRHIGNPQWKISILSDIGSQMRSCGVSVQTLILRKSPLRREFALVHDWQ